ncbi:MAG: thioredoxin-disulfide reductase [Deltaproteobacteria bacterium]|nr:thioredoxin-disulfide reductase [Deltaproteobacteria bacterium]
MERLIIIGSGPAGLTAAIYAARARLDPLVLEGSLSNERGETPGGQLMTTTDVENVPGFPEGVQGPDFMELLRKQATRFGARAVQEDASRVDLGRHPFVVEASDGEKREALALIVATGARAKKADPEGHERFWQRGVSACAICDGALPIFRDKPLAIVGGGDSAMDEAGFLSRTASRVFVIHRRDELRASRILQERVLANRKIEVVWSHVVEALEGGEMLERVALRSTRDGSRRKLEVAGLFWAIGHVPNTAFLAGQVRMDESGYIVLEDGHGQRTSVPGVFAAGDVADRRYRQVVTAAGAGCAAALDAERWLAEVEHSRA